MRLVRLRHQMLIAMGIPACWTAPAAPPQAPPQTPPPKVASGFEAQNCPRDTVVETACGGRRESATSCGLKGTMLAGVEESKLYITAESDDEPSITFREFSFDREATRKYREDLTDATTRAQSCCYSQCTPLVVGSAEPVQLQPGYHLDDKCMPPPANGTSKPAKGDQACPAGIAFDGTLRPYVRTTEGECCYSVPTQQVIIHAVPGRALRVDGVPHVAELAANEGWRADLTPDLDLAPDVRARLARIWCEAARLEHASIAAFASLAMRLLAAGAPADLIAAAHSAALDEVEHARISFELASAYAGERLAPGRFDIAAHAATSGSLRELALETFVDGCINETAAAHQAAVAAEQATDPVVAAALRRIADDETRHAALAWAVVAWCVREGGVSVGELRSLVPSGASAAPNDPNDEDLAAYGVLGDAATAAVREEVVRDVVGPCVDAVGDARAA